jgi:hypothetical protein
MVLARELPNLRTLIDGTAEGTPAGEGREAVASVLKVAQGHPKLLELADGQADDIGRLRGLVGQADATWRERGGLPEGFLSRGQPQASAEDYAGVLARWTQEVANGLSEAARVFFWFLAALEETDRSGSNVGRLVEETWAEVWRRAKFPGDPPDAEPLMGVLGDQALIEMDRKSRDGRVMGCRVHPLVAATAKKQAGGEFQTAVDATLADFWTRVMNNESDNEESTSVVVAAGRSALPYLLRLGEWTTARLTLTQAVWRDFSRSAAGEIIPIARRLVDATAGTDEHLWAREGLAGLTRLVDTPAGLLDARQVMAEAIAADRYDVAVAAAEDVIGSRMLWPRARPEASTFVAPKWACGPNCPTIR